MRLIFSISFLFIALILNGQSSKSHCQKEEKIGNETFCLPSLNEMIECSGDEKIIKYIDKVSLNNNRNIALYLSEKSYLNIDTQKIDDYIIVYTSRKLENDIITNKFIYLMDSFTTQYSKFFIDENWEIIQNEISKKNSDLKFDRPILIDHYFIMDSVPCSITISRISEGFIDDIYVTASVFRSLKDKFIAYAYYLLYDGENSIRKAREKIDYFSFLLDELNSPSKSFSYDIDKTQKDLTLAISYYNIALVKSNENKYKEAVELYTKAIESYPHSALVNLSEAYYNRGLNKRLMNDYSGAISDYSLAIKLRPDYYKAILNRGFTKLILEEYYDAISDFTLIIDSNKSTQEIISAAYGNRGVAKHALEQNACDDFKKAIELGNKKLQELIKDCK
jgi:tetratricopeptide (TPR) repeat protein